jgi:hypothetical protein
MHCLESGVSQNLLFESLNNERLQAGDRRVATITLCPIVVRSITQINIRVPFGCHLSAVNCVLVSPEARDTPWTCYYITDLIYASI